MLNVTNAFTLIATQTKTTNLFGGKQISSNCQISQNLKPKLMYFKRCSECPSDKKSESLATPSNNTEQQTKLKSGKLNRNSKKMEDLSEEVSKSSKKK